jgi:hypothetical protein
MSWGRRNRERERRRRVEETNAIDHGVGVTPWGPHCYLNQEPHPEPFNKTKRAAQRCSEKRAKRQQREEFFNVFED